jgi:hypothetical protein
VVSEGNRFVWPRPDIHPIAPGRSDYGFLPPVLFRQVLERFAGCFAKGRNPIIPRIK